MVKRLHLVLLSFTHTQAKGRGRKREERGGRGEKKRREEEERRRGERKRREEEERGGTGVKGRKSLRVSMQVCVWVECLGEGVAVEGRMGVLCVVCVCVGVGAYLQDLFDLRGLQIGGDGGGGEGGLIQRGPAGIAKASPVKHHDDLVA